MTKYMTYKQWLNKSIQRLKCCSNKYAELDAEILLIYVTGETKSNIIAFSDTNLTKKQFCKLEKLLSRRENGEPIAYIIGEWEFWSLKLKISNQVIVPRPDTECLVNIALSLLPNNNINVLDLGTGSGAIALALASERSKWNITGIDCVANAVILANKNACNLNLNNVKFYHCNWYNLSKFIFIKHYYDLIVSNPPYISDKDPILFKGSLKFEPKIALAAKENGLKELRTICIQSRKYLSPFGWLLLEHGKDQGSKVRNILNKINLKNIKTFRDYNCYERVTLAQNYFH